MYPSLKAALNDNTAQMGEVGLFRRMLEYFNSNPACAVLETHQKYVRFDNNQRKCEISDLMIVSYSTKYKCMKLTFLQAKCAKREGYGLTYNGFKFILDNKQYQLLKKRPVINPLSSGLSPTILHIACSPAISSYGVFYWDKHKDINFGFEVTDLLRPVNEDETSSSKTCYFKDIGDIRGNYPWWVKYLCCVGLKCVFCQTPKGCEKKPCCSHDLFSTIDVNCFENALTHFEIGSPICAECVKACQPMQDIARTVFSSINAATKHKQNKDVDMSAFNHFETVFGSTGDGGNSVMERKVMRDYEGGDRNGDENNEIMSFAAKNILLINADEYGYEYRKYD